jgi:hypothetical protein
VEQEEDDMIVNRRTFVAQRGHLNQVARMLVDGCNEMGLGKAARVLVAEAGPFDQAVMEIEFETWEAYHSFTTELAPDPKWWKQWYAITESGGTNEVWRVVE